ncbi:MAG TPA: AraC family transcriptional regulator [Polyangiaceae bacterium]|nr:AraC family transcriptional regulator [Polyangiaceae bacterium]
MVATSEGPTSMRLLRPFMRCLLARGVELLPLIEGMEIDPAVFTDPDGRISWEQTLILMERAERASNDPAIGLHAAEHIHHGDFDVLEMVARASGTRRGALRAVSRYAALMKEGAILTHTVEGSEEAWTLTLPPPDPRIAVEFVLGVFVLVGRTLSGGNENPDRILLRSPAPPNPEEYERVFGCPVGFGADRNAFVMSTVRLDRTIARITPSLALAMEQLAEKLLAELPKASPLSTRVREQIVDALRSGPATLEDIAARLKLSGRTLRRHLQEEGQTFSELLSEVRRDLARRYLEDEDRSITEVAFLLGFTDTSAFQRSFRKWFDSSPSEYRKSLAAR